MDDFDEYDSNCFHGIGSDNMYEKQIPSRFQRLKSWWKNYCWHVWLIDHDSTYDYKRTCLKCGKIEEGSNK